MTTPAFVPPPQEPAVTTDVEPVVIEDDPDFPQPPADVAEDGDDQGDES